MEKYSIERFLQLVLALDDKTRQELYYILKGYQLSQLINKNQQKYGKEN